MDSQRVEFANREGHTLAAQVTPPRAGTARAWALFAHCFTCSKDLKSARIISNALAQEGIGVLRFDFTGLGESEGDFSESNFSSNVSDLVAAADFLEEEYGAPSILIGHSLGGAAVLKAAADIPATKAVATIGAPSEPDHVTRLLSRSLDEIEATGEAEVEIAGRRFCFKKQFLDDLEAGSMREAIASLRKALLVFHAPMDQVVGIQNAADIYQAAKHPKSFVSLDNADHLLSDRSDAEYVASVLSAWARRYIPDSSEHEPVLSSDGAKVVVRSGPTGFRTQVLAAGHWLLADEPESAGGTDSGPDPYALLLAGLGACTAMTLRMYADRKSWPLEGVKTALDHEKIHAKDCAECETREGKVDRIRRRIRLEGPLDESQRARLLEIADRCPVHRTLTSEIRIESELEPQS